MKEQARISDRVEGIWAKGKDVGAGRELRKCQRGYWGFPLSPSKSAIGNRSQGPKASQELSA